MNINPSEREKIRKRLQSNQFREWLNTRGYTAASFARRYGIPPETVRSWRNGTRWNDLLPIVCSIIDEHDVV